MNIKAYKKELKDSIEKIKLLQLKALDNNSQELKKAFDILYNEHIFELYKIDKSLHNDYKFVLFSTLTPFSGSLAFLAIQILAANSIMQNNNFPKKEEYFKKKCGIAINHLRAPVTLVSAQKSLGGYKLQGKLTWASGYGIFDTLLIGFHHEGQEYEVMAEFKNSKTFQIGEVATSFVGNSMATVNIELHDFFVKEEDVVSSKPMGNYTQAKAVSKTVHFALYGLGLGAIEALKDKQIIEEATLQLDAIKKQFLSTENGEKMEKIRIQLFFLVQQIITTGMVLYGGKSILIEEKMQEYYRELIMFNSNGLNNSIKMLFQENFLHKIKD